MSLTLCPESSLEGAEQKPHRKGGGRARAWTCQTLTTSLALEECSTRLRRQGGLMVGPRPLAGTPVGCGGLSPGFSVQRQQPACHTVQPAGAQAQCSAPCSLGWTLEASSALACVQPHQSRRDQPLGPRNITPSVRSSSHIRVVPAEAWGLPQMTSCTMHPPERTNTCDHTGTQTFRKAHVDPQPRRPETHSMGQLWCQANGRLSVVITSWGT